MTEHGEADLKRRLRAALAAAEPHHVPGFARLWAAAAADGRPAASARRALALLAAALAVVALAVLIGYDRRGARALDDYRLAVALRLDVEAPSPLDRLAATMPKSIASGTPGMPDYSYPLMPKETVL